MSEIFNRTLLYSGAESVSSCNLSEPVQNFQYMRIVTSPNYAFDVTAVSSIDKGKAVAAGYYQNASYLDWQYLYSITNSGQTLTYKNFQIIIQQGQNAAKLFGSASNRDSNIKHIKAVYGINRVSGTPTSAIGEPINGAGWIPYTETLLATSNVSVSSLTLSEPASAFNRIKLVVGTVSECRSVHEVNAPIADNDKVTVKSYWGNNTAYNYIAMSRYTWLSGTTVLSSIGGKSFAPNWNSANPWTAAGGLTNEGWRWRPVYAVYGINRK